MLLILEETLAIFSIEYDVTEWPSSKSLQTINAGEGVEKRWWECKLLWPQWRTLYRFLKKLNLELPYDPTIPLLGIHLEKTTIQKRLRCQHFAQGQRVKCKGETSLAVPSVKFS